LPYRFIGSTPGIPTGAHPEPEIAGTFPEGALAKEPVTLAMPIEFRCTGCGKLLRTGDETGGQQAKCPACGVVTTIPLASGQPGFAPLPSQAGGFPSAVPPPIPRSPQASVNPFQSPAEPGARPMSQAPGALASGRLDIGDVLNRTWTIYKANMGNCIGAVMIVQVVNFGTQFASGAISEVIQRAMGNNAASIVIGSILLPLGMALLQMWLGIGLIRYLVKMGRGEHARFEDLFSGAHFIWPVFVSSLLFVLAIASIIAVALLPALLTYLATREQNPSIAVAFVGGGIGIIAVWIVTLMLGQYQYLIIDRDAGIVESLQLSKQITQGNKLMLFVLFIVVGLINLGGMLALCVGMIFTMPYCVLCIAVAYLIMSGQQTADQLEFGRPTSLN
jgi:phage FluMu protein Com